MQLHIIGAVVAVSQRDWKGKTYYDVSVTSDGSLFRLNSTADAAEACKKYILKEGNYMLTVEARDIKGLTRFQILGIAPAK